MVHMPIWYIYPCGLFDTWRGGEWHGDTPALRRPPARTPPPGGVLSSSDQGGDSAGGIGPRTGPPGAETPSGDPGEESKGGETEMSRIRKHETTVYADCDGGRKDLLCLRRRQSRESVLDYRRSSSNRPHRSTPKRT